MNKESIIRNTKQRSIILEELKKLHCHPTANELYQIVSKKNSKIGIATIYRTLDFLEKNNQIIKLKTRGDENRYDGCIEKHCHLICKKCHGIEDVSDIKSVKISSEQLKKSGFEIDFDFLEISGLCKKCAN